MADKNVNIKIQATDETQKAFDRAKRNLTDISGNVSKLGKTFSSAFTWGAIAGGVTLITGQLTAMMNEYAVAEKADLSFKNTFENNWRYNADSLEKFAKTFEMTMGEDGDTIKGLMVFLEGSGRTEEQMKRLIEVGKAYATATGKDLSSAVMELNKTFSGTEGKLGTIIPGMADLTEEELRAGGAVEAVARQFGHLNDAVAGLTDTKVKALNTAVGDLREAIGANVAELFSPMMEGIAKLAAKWAELLEKHKAYRDVMKKSQDEWTIQDEITVIQHKIDEFKAAQASAMAMAVGPKPREGEDQTAYNKKLAMFMATDPNQRQILSLQHQLTPLYMELSKATAELAKAEAVLTGVTKTTATPGDKKEPPPDPWSDEVIFNMGEVFTFAKDEWSHLTEEEYKLAEYYTGKEYQDYLNNLEAPEVSASFVPEPEPPPEGFNFMEALTGDFTSILSNAGGSLATVFNSLTTAAGPWGLLLMALGQIFSAMLKELGPLIDTVLKPIFGVLAVLGKLLAATLKPQLEMLAPVIEAVAKGFVWLYNNAIRHFANGVIGIFNALHNAFAWLYNGISVFVKGITFGLVNIGKMDYRDLAQGFLGEITLADLTAAGEEANSGGGGGGGAGASYTGSRNITMNFYNSAPIVGDSGIRQLATVVRDELLIVERYA